MESTQPLQASDAARVRPVWCSSRTGELVEQAVEGDPVVLRAGVWGGEPCGVLADLVEAPLQVEQLDHLGKDPRVLRRHAGVDEHAQVELGRCESEGVPVDEVAGTGRLDRKSTRLNSSHLGISY